MAPALDPSSFSNQPPFWPMVSPGTPWLSHLSEALTSEGLQQVGPREILALQLSLAHFLWKPFIRSSAAPGMCRLCLLLSPAPSARAGI